MELKTKSNKRLQFVSNIKIMQFKRRIETNRKDIYKSKKKREIEVQIEKGYKSAN